jgi:hypothetical protein
MDELFSRLVGNTDTAVVGGIGILTALVLTQVIKGFFNLDAWGPFRNPWHGADTNRYMPVVALLVGAAYGVLLGPAPGAVDNLRNGLVYGGWSIVAYQIVKRSVLGQ